MDRAGAAVLVPVKAFSVAKARLAGALPAAERAVLARTMAEGVLAAAAPLPVFVACDDEGVRDWATSRGAGVVWTPGTGLDGAVQRGVAELAAQGVATVVVAHADLPRARALSRLLEFPGVTIVPDRRDDGSNVITVPSDAGFTFAYGPGSFARHVAEAGRLGLELHITRLPELQWDVDTPEDLSVPTAT